MVSHLAIWLVKHRLLLFLSSLMLIVITGVGLTKLSVKSDYKIFFEKTDPERLASERMEAQYTSSQNIIIVVNPLDNEIFTASNLAAITWLTESAWQVPYSQRIDSVTNFQHTSADGDELIVGDLVKDAKELDADKLATIKQIATSEPMLVNRLVSPSGHVAAIFIQLSMPDDQTVANNEVMEHVRSLRDKFEQRHPELNLEITGVTPLNHAFNEMTLRDSSTIVPLMLLVILVLVGIMLRSGAATVVTLLILILSVISAIASMGWLNIAVNNINSVAPVIILTLAVADCIHILTNYLKAWRQGLNKQAAMIDSLTLNIKPVFLTSITTAIGFLSMLTSDSPPFRQLGVVSASGVIFAFIFSLTVLPQLTLWFSRKAPKTDPDRTVLFSHVAELPIRHPRLLFYGCLITAIGCISFITNNELNDDNFGYFDQSLEVRQAADFTEENLTGLSTIEYSLDTGQANGANNPVFLAKVEAFSNWFRQQDHVTHVYTYTDTLKRLNKNMHGDDEAFYSLPESKALASQYQLLFEMSIPYGMDLNNQVKMDKSGLRVSISLEDTKAKDILEIDEKAQNWLNTHAPELTTHGASPSMMFATIGQKNIHSMIKGTIIATLLISALLILALGSWKLGLLSLIPNAFPAAIMLGVWGLFIGEVNQAVAVVFGVTLGIVVDDTVHFLTKYLRGYQLTRSVPQAIHYAFEHVGAAIMTTTIVLAIGFSILGLSDFNVNSILGTMISMTIIIALLFDFLFLPAMMMMFGRFIHTNTNASGTPQSKKDVIEHRPEPQKHRLGHGEASL